MSEIYQTKIIISPDEAFEYLNKIEIIQKIEFIKKYGELNIQVELPIKTLSFNLNSQKHHFNRQKHHFNRQKNI